MSKAFKSVGKAIASPLGAIGGAAIGGGIMGPIGSVLGAGIGGSQSVSGDLSGVSGQLSLGQQAAARGADIGTGRNFAKSVIPTGSLGRLGESADVKGSLDVLRSQLGGFTAPEMQAQRDIVGQGINRNTQMRSRALASAQARAGVRGATAAQQQSNVLAEGQQMGANMERDLALRNRAEQTSAAQNLLKASSGVSQFDMSQAARERFAELSTGLGFAQIGSAERSGVTAGNAAVQAANAAKPSGGLLGGVLGK